MFYIICYSMAVYYVSSTLLICPTYSALHEFMIVKTFIFYHSANAFKAHFPCCLLNWNDIYVCETSCVGLCVYVRELVSLSKIRAHKHILLREHFPITKYPRKWSRINYVEYKMRVANPIMSQCNRRKKKHHPRIHTFKRIKVHSLFIRSKKTFIIMSMKNISPM